MAMITVKGADGQEYACTDRATADRVMAEKGGHVVTPPSRKTPFDDALRAELDALAETYWRWAIREDCLAGHANDLHRALIAALAAVAPEGTDGAEFAYWVSTAFSDNRPDKPLSECIAMALTPEWRGAWDEGIALAALQAAEEAEEEYANRG